MSVKRGAWVATCLLTLSGVLLPRVAFARMVGGNLQLDHPIFERPDSFLIVAGRFVEGPGNVQVESVIAGDPTVRNTQLWIGVQSFHWPQVLVPRRIGTRCILILRPKCSGVTKEHQICAVIPTRRQSFERASDSESFKRLAANEILAELADERSEERQQHLILQVAPILTANEARRLTPFLESKNLWLRRAALAGILNATKEEKYLQMAIEDVRQFIETTNHLEWIPWFEPGTKAKPYAVLVKHYFFLDHGWSTADDQKKAAFTLPLFRLLATKAPAAYRWPLGIEPLCHLGTAQDVPFLHECLGSVRLTDQEAAIIRDALQRLGETKKAAP
ncbi:MAG: hypothetical protein HZA91_14505 [Verrucomicrobia bacterium]|nr:hypothetical protein [Verrucomicrobiota bacterium]